ncbi:MAG: SDR family oxidoreductase [Gemmatimonadota bacterium]
MTDPFAAEVFLITGASRGIGRAVALRLAGPGTRLSLTGRDVPALESVAAACRDAGASALVTAGDVGDPGDVAAVVQDTADRFGGVDVLVCNAGVSMVSPFEDLPDPRAIEQLIRVNYLGSVYCVQACLPHLIRARGRIVAVASLSALTGVPTRTGYAASKAAMATFFDSLRIELAHHGVSVTVAYPGFVDTGIRERATGTGEGRGQGAGRIMTADECARRIINAARVRRREVVMTARGKLGRWLRLIAPRLVDRIAARAVGWP